MEEQLKRIEEVMRALRGGTRDRMGALEELEDASECLAVLARGAQLSICIDRTVQTTIASYVNEEP